ncbi:glycogen debranching N-terminal domain-containing protein [Streptomyces ipomoeae]|uniref:amylo-alpha-1,6-glucosidase n=1 Tax=Streptomyces ipomoeae TaxID=103232 RepID=UPI0029B82172|nr:glycogen debranching N-terminal domain-containing protein [Streptomyces ipomoeae]MDX2822171.1 glycogen debranching N-terminal domain-containing protein [Streptomyces ipomoeae]MDX2873766.1 glycogen debranching N-terminal domain-containing protein [Streptomyces ipomoeae]
MTYRHHLLVRGGTFAAVGDGGDISGVRGGNSPDGLFVRDARHLSRWQLTVDGAVPETLTPVADGDIARCVLVPRGGRQEPPAYTLFREQAVSDSAFVESLRVTSNHPVPTTVRVAITADADFTDQFELRSDFRTYAKSGIVRKREVLPDGVEFTYRRGEWRSCTTVTAEPAPDAVEETGTGARRLVWALDLEPHGSVELILRVMARPHGDKRALRVPRSPAAVNERTLALEEEFIEGVAFPTGWPELAAACARGLADLAALQVPATGPDGETLRVPAAGAPWFLTLLGRDALLTSLFALPYRPEPAAATLLALAAAQATEVSVDSVAQPGKIVHEMRHGELAHFGQVPYGRYYGSVDATPLFLVLLGAYVEQTGDVTLARRLEPHARAAIGWMLDHGGLTSRGYLVYRADEGGLANQNWKDSPGSICSADGSRPVSGPVMAAGAQGYAYDALRRTAWVARTVWEDEVYAALLEQAAADLRDRFQRDFWMTEQAFPALALDREGKPVDALASDAGHLLWSGLLDKEYGELVGRRLLEPDFFSGWGVRTLAAGQPAYHPLSYHRGSVWPHDNALITLGLARYGLHDEARTVALGLVDAATAAGHRLPEVIAGYGRDTHGEPVPYPHACVRESRAAAAPLALLTAVGGA